MNIIAGILLLVSAQSKFDLDIDGKTVTVTSQYDWDAELAKAFSAGMVKGMGAKKKFVDGFKDADKLYTAVIHGSEDFFVEVLGKEEALKYLRTGDLGFSQGFKIGFQRRKLERHITEKLDKLMESNPALPPKAVR